MNPERWPEVERLYEQVIALPIDQRARFLETSSNGDEELRREVGSLLSLESASADFLEQPALRAAATTLSHALPHLKLPEVPGYHIVRELGEGGMGVVYLAEQRTPLKRIVALKLIRPGMDSRHVLARFERERQALARMDHPNIAAVFDAGSTADGRPYFVMEFVNGVAITEYCDSRQLSIHARLSLFIQVCHAVQHAHQKGVIHRDLKPSNVLVIDQDGRPVPKVIDFGTAKSADPMGEAITLTTDGLVFGTVEYMSPEQAAFSSDIDTTTDVYSLGVLLYELLVGCTPFNRHEIEAKGLEAILKAIRDSDPPRPSSLVTRDRDFVASVAARSTDVGALTKQLAGDLDWIVLKALEKDRRRRYQTAASLGADVQRFQDSKPIEARPPSVPYRVRKFTRRYRGAVAATVALLWTMTLGLVTSTNLYWKAERNLKDAEAQRILAESRGAAAEAATRSAIAQKAEADRFRDEAERQSRAAITYANTLSAANSALINAAFVSSIVAADTDVRFGRLGSARNRLLAIPARDRNWEWHYLFNQTDDSVFKTVSKTPLCIPGVRAGMVPGETSQALSFDAVGQSVVFRRCGEVEAWSESGARVAAFRAPPPGSLPQITTALAVEPTSKMMVVANTVGTGTRPWSVRVFTPQTGSVVELGRFDAMPACADITRDGNRVALGFQTPLSSPSDRSLTHSFGVWTASGDRISRYEPPAVERGGLGFAISCEVKFNPDGRLVASSGGTVDVWNAGSGAEYLRDSGRAGAQSQPVVFSESGDKLAIGRANGSLDVFQVANLNEAPLKLNPRRPEEPEEAAAGTRPIAALPRSSTIFALAFSPDGLTLASGAGKSVTVWDLTQRTNRIQSGHEDEIIGVAISADGKTVYSVDAGGNLRGWPVKPSPATNRSPLTFATSNPIIVSDSGAVVVGSGPDGELSLLHLPGLQKRELRRGSGKFSLSSAVAVSGDGTRIYVEEPDSSGGLQVLMLTTDNASIATQELSFGNLNCETTPQRYDSVGNLALSPDSRYLAASKNNCIAVFDARTLERIANIKTPSLSRVTRLMFRRDGVVIAATKELEFERKSIVLAWDWKKKALASVYPRTASESVVIGLIQSAGGQRIGMLIFTFGHPTILSVWDGALRNELGRVEVGETASVALSPDGTRAVSVSPEDPDVHLWDIVRFSHVLTLPDTDEHRSGVSFTRSGLIIAGRSDGRITIWDPRPPNSR